MIRRRFHSSLVPAVLFVATLAPAQFVDFVPYQGGPLNTISVAFYLGDDRTTNHYYSGNTTLSDGGSFTISGYAPSENFWNVGPGITLTFSDLGSPDTAQLFLKFQYTANLALYGYPGNLNFPEQQIVISGLFPADPTERVNGFSYTVAGGNYRGTPQLSFAMDALAGTLTITRFGAITGFNQSPGGGAAVNGSLTVADISTFPDPAPVPEPASVALLMALGAGLATWWRRRHPATRD